MAPDCCLQTPPGEHTTGLSWQLAKTPKEPPQSLLSPAVETPKKMFASCPQTNWQGYWWSRLSGSGYASEQGVLVDHHCSHHHRQAQGHAPHGDERSLTHP